MNWLLDTNVVSEPMKPQPNTSVLRFLHHTNEDRHHISAATLAELHRGLALLETGRRRRALESWLVEELPVRFEGRILDFTPRIAVVWGPLMAESRRSGTNLSVMDGLLAATAIAHGMIFVTRNTRHFTGLGLELRDPWLDA